MHSSFAVHFQKDLLRLWSIVSPPIQLKMSVSHHYYVCYLWGKSIAAWANSHKGHNSFCRVSIHLFYNCTFQLFCFLYYYCFVLKRSGQTIVCAQQIPCIAGVEKDLKEILLRQFSYLIISFSFRVVVVSKEKTMLKVKLVWSLEKLADCHWWLNKITFFIPPRLPNFLKIWLKNFKFH